MKLEKDNAMDRADACEQQAKDANLRAERVRKKNPLILVFSSFRIRLIRAAYITIKNI